MASALEYGFPKLPEQFPYVKECHRCAATGIIIIISHEPDDDEEIHTWGGGIVRTIHKPHTNSFRCATCSGRGHIIPPEWTDPPCHTS